jgi:glycerophosphoryl diester phosphodiesterase
MIETILCILGGYGILSSALFLFPFWKKKTPMKHPIFKKCLEGKGVMHISHRGGSREGFENTMEAFQKAV